MPLLTAVEKELFLRKLTMLLPTAVEKVLFLSNLTIPLPTAVEKELFLRILTILNATSEMVTLLPPPFDKILRNYRPNSPRPR